ncbi:C25 family cysteine peptidase [Candidatus Uabimicrobium sp. HlEnr_7]|uniref:C25 family cysteine peptidase n=1 Tax=Candidatus Uabimicrobium helgolandensis TaxID=3095367 RepID=UPI003557E711
MFTTSKKLFGIERVRIHHLYNLVIPYTNFVTFQLQRKTMRFQSTLLVEIFRTIQKPKHGPILIILFFLYTQILADQAIKITVNKEGPYVIYFDQIKPFFAKLNCDYLHLKHNGKNIPLCILNDTESQRKALYFYNTFPHKTHYLLWLKNEICTLRWQEKTENRSSKNFKHACIIEKVFEQNNVFASFPQENLPITPLHIDYKMWKQANRSGLLEIQFSLDNYLPKESEIFIDLIHSYTRKAIGQTKIFLNDNYVGKFDISSLKKIKTTHLQLGNNVLRFELTAGSYLPVYLNRIIIRYLGVIRNRGRLLLSGKKHLLTITNNDMYFFLDKNYVYQRVKSTFFCEQSGSVYFWRKKDFLTPTKITTVKDYNLKSFDANYIIIAPTVLQSTLTTLVHWRQKQNHKISFISPQQIYNTFGNGIPSSQAIKNFVAYAHKKNSSNLEYLLLVGDVFPDTNFGIPTNYVYTYFDGVTASDFPYSLDGHIAVGRIPSQNPQTLKKVIAKIIDYESKGGLWQRRIDFVAGQGGFGEAIDNFSELIFKKLIASYLPVEYKINMAYANPSSPYFIPPQKFTERILQKIQKGSLFFVYIGHGNRDSFSRIIYKNRKYKMFGLRDVAKLAKGNTSPIMVSIACSNSYFDGNSLGEKLLLHPFGPAAFLGSTRISHPYANALVGKSLLKGLFEKKITTLGKLVNHVNKELKSPPRFDFLQILIDGGAKIFTIGTPLQDLKRIRKEHRYLYNILGDPAIRIRYPQSALSIEEKNKDTKFLTLKIKSSVKIPQDTIVKVSMEKSLFTANKKNESTYHTVNNNAIFKISTTYKDGVFRIPTENLKSDKYYVKVCMVIENNCFVGTYLYSKGKTNGN